MKTALFLMLAFCGLTTSAFSQFRCGANEKLVQLSKDPAFVRDQEELLKKNYRLQEKGDDTMVVFSIPIVFHIIHYNGAENITDEQIYDQVNILNRDFRLLNDDTSEVVNSFKSVYSDVGIEFKLAKDRKSVV